MSSVLLLPLLSGTSNASDSKVHSAVFCRVAPVAMAPSTSVQYVGTEIQNLGNQPMSVICPVVRDTVFNHDGWDNISIGVFDRSPVADIQCSAYSRQRNGIVEFEGNFSSAGALALGWGTLQGPGATASAGYGYYHINCIIPPRFVCPGACACSDQKCDSGIAYYRVQEPDGL